MDFLFDLIGASILILHILMAFPGVYYHVLPNVLMVFFFFLSRTSMAAIGHYHSHRKKDGITDWGDCLFDMQYVGTSIIAFDGHGMIHHTQTNSLADVKRTIFTGVLNIPRLWRVPAETIRRFGHIFTGIFIRWASLHLIENENTQRIFLIQARTMFIRLLLIAECVFAWFTDNFCLWCAQYFVSLWYNLFLIVSSHHFEEGYDSKASTR